MNSLIIHEPRNYKLYVHINKVNNKRYFGITKNRVQERWEKNGRGYKKSSRIRKAFDKYGWNNFEHFIVIDKLTYTEAVQYEEDFIRIFDTTNNKFGYNVDKGGRDCTPRFCTKKRMEKEGLIKPVIHLETMIEYADSSAASYYTGYKAESIRRTCNSKKFLLFNSHWMFKEDFVKLTSQDIEEILKIKPKNYMHDNRKVVCLETLEIFENAEQAQKSYSSTTETCIGACCKHTDPNRITAGGVHWLYLSEYKSTSKQEVQEILNRKAGQKSSKAVIKLETLEEYPSIEEASTITGLSSKTIRYSCTGQRITNPKNGHWMFKEDYLKATSEEVEARLKKRIKSYNRRKVQCVETGQIFDCISQANDAVGGCHGNSMISKCCKNSSITYKGYHWRYI